VAENGQIHWAIIGLCLLFKMFNTIRKYCSCIGNIIIIIIIIIFNLRTAGFKAYCTIWVRRSNFRHQASPRVSPRESTQRRKVELWARNVREFCLNADFHVTFRDLLHAVKLRHRTDGFTSPPKEGVLKNFFFFFFDGFGRVWTRELGYQRPSRYLYTTEAACMRNNV
jgi:hypothetical protein